ncbi:serine/threonine protein kinase [Candidatus Uabimicrobium sp. HlEnr_7]|uniref:serine/threonine protein kinase n=1 Tax=Candidatus Uabimicrobium helgolandensis TaxID=3095367 RepID=UPI003556157A
MDSKLKFDQLGPYKIIEKIGSGGMGIVYKSEHTDSKKIFAVKVLNITKKIERSTIERFIREINLTARLDHKNIIKLHDKGVANNSIPYFVMDFIDGVTLTDFLNYAPDHRTLVRIFIKIAEAISYAHQQEIIHRDLKPANIMIDKRGKPIVMDFGLAKSSINETLTATGVVMGSMHYMSPEQADGQRRNIDNVSDIYSLGAILYYCLTSRPPFVGSNSPEIMAKIFNQIPVAPHKINKKIPGALSAICLKALAKKKHARYQNAEEFKEDLQNFITNKKISTSLVTTLMWQPTRWIKTNKWLTILNIIIVIIIIFIYQR